jgi:SAM-dependent methyltransferase
MTIQSPDSDVSCILCNGAARRFANLSSVPINVSQLFRSAEDARRAPVGRLALAACDSCGAVFNAAFDPQALEYNGDYENSLDSSALFDSYMSGLATRLSDEYPARGGRIIEIGCGQAGFLTRLCAAAAAEGAGFDPGYIGPASLAEGKISIHRRHFRAADAANATMVICRHVLEHLEDPAALLAELKGAAPDAVFYFEVPNADSIFDGTNPWDLIYPHVTYFGLEALLSLFRSAGFRVLRAGTSYGGQFLYIEADLKAGEPPKGAERSSGADAGRAGFAGVLEDAVAGWSDYIARAHSQNKRIAFWGAGAKGVTFLNIVPGASAIDAVVDINPRKQSSFVPGTGQPVLAPQSLLDVNPDFVITTNPIYSDEIASRMKELGIQAEIVHRAPTGLGKHFTSDRPPSPSFSLSGQRNAG